MATLLESADLAGASASATLSVGRAPPAARSRWRVPEFEGIRGLAAFYVVVYHVGVVLKDTLLSMSLPWRSLHRCTEHGHDAVVCFIVLSGFVLMLPVTADPLYRLPGGFAEYFRRRARRILPPYFSALALILLGGLLCRLAGASTPNAFVRHWDLGSVLSHLVLVHNFQRSWAIAFDSPMWSVATEWQIYLIFPILLLPVWRRFGNTAVIAIAFAVGMLPVRILGAAANFDTTCPWFLAMFAIGMAGAFYARSHIGRDAAWGGAAQLAFAAILVLEWRLTMVWKPMGLWFKDLLNGLAFGLTLVFMARLSRSGAALKLFPFRLLSSPPLLLLGSMSYSLYLIHYPVVDSLYLLLGTWISGKALIVATFVLAPLLSLAVAYPFYVAFEKGVMWKWIGDRRESAKIVMGQPRGSRVAAWRPRTCGRVTRADPRPVRPKR